MELGLRENCLEQYLDEICRFQKDCNVKQILFVAVRWTPVEIALEKSLRGHLARATWYGLGILSNHYQHKILLRLLATQTPTVSNICYACTTGIGKAFVLSQNSARKSSRLRRRRRNARLASNTLIPLPLPPCHSPVLSSRNFESWFHSISTGIPRTCASNILRDRNFSLHPASVRLLDLRRPLYEEEWPLVSTGNARNSRNGYRRRVLSDERLVIDDIERELHGGRSRRVACLHRELGRGAATRPGAVRTACEAVVNCGHTGFPLSATLHQLGGSTAAVCTSDLHATPRPARETRSRPVSNAAASKRLLGAELLVYERLQMVHRALLIFQIIRGPLEAAVGAQASRWACSSFATGFYSPLSEILGLRLGERDCVRLMIAEGLWGRNDTRVCIAIERFLRRLRV
ncbi:hypothetical protein WN48_07811 [Eufriesea mexicana]|uniref:Uncharacterized protein n=1 Tax=Eufriesea mexicana TaxID=516756 RepID=A0A310SC57_9HYME|nr:hypothetical protein WN48_07811 [Eufriesea mexicana]